MTSGSNIPVPASPRVLWIELTSKCAFDCVFCSRKLRRGAGEHMPLELYRRLLEQLVDPRILVLNYSGESTYYPHLLTAIEMAHAAGAYVELVSVLASVPEERLHPLVNSGLNRLTVSLHTTDSSQFRQIYGFSELAVFLSRFERLMDLCGRAAKPPLIDVAFVAMERNLEQLPAVTEYVRAHGVKDILVSPVMRRDNIAEVFVEIEGAGGTHSDRYLNRLRRMMERAREQCPDIRFAMCHPFLADRATQLGEVPAVYPHPLPKGALIHSCEQNPWETAHVLSNGDVVPCEVLDWMPFGNLQNASLEEIWHGARYTEFRAGFPTGAAVQCRLCPWKQAFIPGPMSSDVIAARGRSAQLMHGWHRPEDGPIIWSTQSATAVLKPRPASRALHVSGLLPRAHRSQPNVLTITCNGETIGTVENPWDETMPFGLDFPAPSASPVRQLGFRTSSVFRPSRWGPSEDDRDLGFALVLLSSRRWHNHERRSRHLEELSGLRSVIEWSRRVASWFSHRPRAAARPTEPGVSIVIPERDNALELAECLDAAWRARMQLNEPVQIIVMVNGSPAEQYSELRARYSGCTWWFHPRALPFAAAVKKALGVAQYDWVYLLNNDVALDPDALSTILAERDGTVFSIGSQILLKDTTRFREETNFTRLRVEDGMVEAHDLIPTSSNVVESAYSGGGASLFQTRLLSRYVADSVGPYAPFYWEDIEWGWRARKAGYRNLFCPASIAHHGRRATIGKHYSDAEVEQIINRNRVMFQLRNLTEAGSLDRVLEEAAAMEEDVVPHFLGRRTAMEIFRARVRNHLAPVRDDEILS